MNIRPNATVAILDLGNADDSTLNLVEASFRKFDGLTVLEWCVRRLVESAMLDDIVITGHELLTSKLMEASLCSAKWLPSQHKSGVDRADEVAKRFRGEWLVFVAPTCPFADPVLLDRLIASAWASPNADYVGYVHSRRPQFSLAKLGLVGEMCNRKALEKLTLLSDSQKSVETVPNLLRSMPEAFKARLIPLPEMLESDDLKFNLQTAEDCVNAIAVLEAAGDDLSYQRLVRMSEVNRGERPSRTHRQVMV
jgi:spore coat polysaccharide biosynthesis protein SpsF (cytidylyltransferase family)